MKKALKIVLVIVLSLYSVLSTAMLIGSANTQAKLENELETLQNNPQEAYLELKSEYDELKEQYNLLLSGSKNTDVSKPVVDNKTAAPAAKFNADEVLPLLKVTEYSYDTGFWHYAFLVIENTSNFNIKVTANVKFYNEANELIGAQSADQDAFEKGTKIVLYFMPDEVYTRMEYELSVREEDFYDCVVSNLSFESVSAKNKEIVSVTNNGSEEADFVEGYALFFKEDKVVGFDSTYFIDDDDELKAGKTITKEINCYDEYDSVQFFFTGRR